MLEKFEGTPDTSSAPSPPKRQSSSGTTGRLSARFEAPADSAATSVTPASKPRTSSTGSRTGDLLSKFETRTPSTNGSAASNAMRGVQPTPTTPAVDVVSGTPDEDPSTVTPRLSENPFMRRDSKIGATPATGQKAKKDKGGLCKCLCFAPKPTSVL